MRFYSFKYLDKLLRIIDVGLLDDLKNNTPENTSTSKNNLLRILKSKFRSLIWIPISYFFKKTTRNSYGKNWLIHESINNYKALEFLKSDINVFVKPHKDLVYKHIFFYKLLYTIPLLFFLIKKGKLRWFFMYYDCLGLLEESDRLIKLLKPEKIIFANDVNPIQIALRIVAQDNKIPTYYFQHACITKYMPPLEFDVAFLEGQDSYDKYKKIGNGIIKSKVELIGMVKYLKHLDLISNSSNVNSIGIALNTLDSEEQIKSLVSILKKTFPKIDLHLRMHPGDSRVIDIEENVLYSDAKIEDVFSFLGKIDLIIAGDSSILLEATLLNIVPVYYKFYESNLFDVYGFVKNNLVTYVENENKLISYINSQIKKKDNVINRASYYNENIKSGVNCESILKKYNLF